MRHLILLLLTACTPIEHVAVDGWPALEVSTVVVSHREMRDVCSKYVPWYIAAEGCAIIDMQAKTCTRVLSADFPTEYSAEHESDHCAGMDHPGGTFMRGLLKKAE